MYRFGYDAGYHANFAPCLQVTSGRFRAIPQRVCKPRAFPLREKGRGPISEVALTIRPLSVAHGLQYL